MQLVKFIVLMGALAIMPTQAATKAFEQCQQNEQGTLCQSYLAGVVDGALMYRNDASAAKNIEATSYETRALKYRAGKRYKTASQQYCDSHIANETEIISALTEQIGFKNVTNINELELVINSLMDCRNVK
ncbi:hypothetical protein ACFOD0_07095 [Shewanella intestini]|uniref:Uncharacterized protein n=1 Tax=Shewanella intestini TaxID=2017544 RepID=A0ABS5HZV2_9GAMM|nr:MULTISPECIES: hypothetical protein [Shewanella]MBR9726640.1 hypothetical protein [Shewanella intestini]MRG34794.1 hypothetical protein [Shewanella sp. XMDDZSB0408]